MSKVITFSRTFPAYHQKKGEPTYFVEMIWQSLFNQGLSYFGNTVGLDKELEIFSNSSHFIKPKHHTIRSGNRWKEGDNFSPRVWSGKPYQSKQITIAPDIKIKKIWDIEIYPKPDDTVKGIPVLIFKINSEEYRYGTNQTVELAKNDGLSLMDMRNWFNIHPKSKNQKFIGQIICWDESIKY